MKKMIILIIINILLILGARDAYASEDGNDFSLSNLFVSNTNPNIGEYVFVNVTLTNNKNSSFEDINITFRANGEEIDNRTIDILKPYKNITISFELYIDSSFNNRRENGVQIIANESMQISKKITIQSFDDGQNDDVMLNNIKISPIIIIIIIISTFKKN